MVSVFDPKNGPTYRRARAAACSSWPRAAPKPAFGVLPGIIGSIQALEVIKLILDLGDSPGRILPSTP
ncbi:MAG: hypothetical protein R2705_05915 [Ilumatobacteraceae bacterium]